MNNLIMDYGQSSAVGRSIRVHRCTLTDFEYQSQTFIVNKNKFSYSKNKSTVPGISPRCLVRNRLLSDYVIKILVRKYLSKRFLRRHTRPPCWIRIDCYTMWCYTKDNLYPKVAAGNRMCSLMKSLKNGDENLISSFASSSKNLKGVEHFITIKGKDSVNNFFSLRGNTVKACIS